MKKKHWIASALLVATLFAPVKAEAALCTSGWDCYNKGMTYKGQKKYKEAVQTFLKALETIKDNAYIYDKLAESYIGIGEYQKASDAYFKMANLLIKDKSQVQNYLTALENANKWKSEIKLYKESAPSTNQSLAKYEPTSGAYIGAFITLETKYRTNEFKGWNGNEFADFDAVTGKKHAMYFDYAAYGNPLSTSFSTRVEEIKQNGGAMQIAYEPGKLENVTEEGIRAYAKQLKDTGIPIFLRYASEMNGYWVDWHGNPVKYVENFRMVHDVMAEVAPNVVMVWSPDSSAKEQVDSYYPGDKYVDWVGLSVYSTKFAGGDTKKPSDTYNPLNDIDYFYKKYADRKPMMISEYGASHEDGYGAERQDTSKFAKNQMTLLYEGIRMKYPRVKAINWFSVNRYYHADPVKQRSNFSLLEGQNNGIFQCYKDMIADDYFLSDVVNGPFAKTETKKPNVLVPFENAPVQSNTVLHTWAKSYNPYIKKVTFKLNGANMGESVRYPFTVPTFFKQLKKGINAFEITAWDEAGKTLWKQSESLYLPYFTTNHVRIQIGNLIAMSQSTYQQIESPPYVKKGRTMVPIRFVSTSLGGAVDYDAKTRKVTIKGAKTIVLQQGATSITVNGKKKTIDAAPENKNGRIFVPVRFVSEELGKKVTWNEKEKSILIQ